MQHSIRTLIHDSKQILLNHHIEGQDGLLLISHVLNKSMAYLFAHSEELVNDADYVTIMSLVHKRAKGEPIAYLVNQQGFWEQTLEVNHHTLIPRPETELLVELGLKIIKETTNPKILELGTGSGAIACAIASERPDSQLIATDISPHALSVAKHNGDTHKLTNIHWLKSNWFNQIDSASNFDLIISNPPYIAYNCSDIEAHVAQYEPEIALFSEDNGLSDLNHLIENSSSYLKKNGVVLLEHGAKQGPALRSFASQHTQYKYVQQFKDLNNLERVLALTNDRQYLPYID